MEERTRHVVQDVATLKALAHPIRINALGELRTNGPATASELARALGESSGSLSYHLRQLERFGFVSDDVHRDGRERRWRAVHEMTTLPRALRETPEGRAAIGVVKSEQERTLLRRIEAASLVPGAPFEHSDFLLDLDLADLEELTAQITELVLSYKGRGGEHRIGLHVVAAPSVSR